MNSDLKYFDEAVERLKLQLGFGSSCYAFLFGLANNPDYLEKYNNSYAGHTIDLCLRSVQSSLVLFCSRHWDDNKNSFHSIPTANERAKLALDEIVNRHIDYFEDNGIKRGGDSFYQYYQQLSLDVRETGSSSARAQIRVLRTEQYAHLSADSRDRQKAVLNHPSVDMDKLTNDSLLDFTKKTIQLSERFVYLKERLVPDFEDRVDLFSKYHETFWDNLPFFAKVESPL